MRTAVKKRGRKNKRRGNKIWRMRSILRSILTTAPATATTTTTTTTTEESQPNGK
jgi:hypothetical protein